MMRAYRESRLEDAVSRLLSATSTECIEFFRRYDEMFRAIDGESLLIVINKRKKCHPAADLIFP